MRSSNAFTEPQASSVPSPLNRQAPQVSPIGILINWHDDSAQGHRPWHRLPGVAGHDRVNESLRQTSEGSRLLPSLPFHVAENDLQHPKGELARQLREQEAIPSDRLSSSPQQLQQLCVSGSGHEESYRDLISDREASQVLRAQGHLPEPSNRDDQLPTAASVSHIDPQDDSRLST